MIESTRGLVFHTMRYSETSAVVKIFTEQFGLMSFLVKGLYSRRPAIRPAMFGHLSLLDLVVDRREHKDLHFIREISFSQGLPGLRENMARSSVALYLNELLYKCVKEEEKNLPLFGFIVSSLQQLDKPDTPVQAFHLLFMLKLSKFLGFFPRLIKTDKGSFFDMEEGIFMDSEPLHRYFIAGKPAAALEQLQSLDYPDLSNFRIPPDVRNELLDRLLDYYRLHIPGLGELKSIAVLHELLA